MRNIKLINALLPKTRQDILTATVPHPEKSWYISELAQRFGVIKARHPELSAE